MRKHWFYRACLMLCGLFLMALAGMAITGNIDNTVLSVIFCFTFLLLCMQGYRQVKWFSFTVWVLAAAVLAMFFPEQIVQIGGYETERLIVPLIQIIMFGMGTAMSLQDFAGVVRMPKGVLVGLACQFSIMPALGVLLALLMGFPPEIAAGVILIGSSPSGVSSNVMAFLSKGNIALSVTLTPFEALLPPVMTPLRLEFRA